jgi:hypothetical protein
VQARLVRAAARNNADWCAAVSRAHGVPNEFGTQAWTAQARTPVLYPDAVTLVPGADPDAITDAIDLAAPAPSVKDSFADLDLAPLGFRVLFTAQWIARPAGPPSRTATWEPVRDRQTLRAWARAWDGGAGHAELFRPQLLDDRATTLLCERATDGRVVGGAVLIHSACVVGVSNLFTDRAADLAWSHTVATVDAMFAGVPVVAYARSADLAAAARHGFTPIGPLRVWVHD